MLTVGLKYPIKLMSETIFYANQHHINLDCVKLLLKYCRNEHSDIANGLKRLTTNLYDIQSDETFRTLVTDDLQCFKKICQKMKNKEVGYYIFDDDNSCLLHIAARNGAEKL